MEYFDVVNSDRKFINKTLPRGSKLSTNEFNVGIECLIINSNNEILLTQRAPQKSHCYQWEIPGGCSIAGESSVQTLIREISEEMGIDITNKFIFVDTQLYKTQFVDIYCSYLDLDIQKLKLQKEEVIDAKWFSWYQLQEMIKENQIVPCVVQIVDIIENLIKIVQKK